MDEPFDNVTICYIFNALASKERQVKIRKDFTNQSIGKRKIALVINNKK